MDVPLWGSIAGCVSCLNIRDSLVSADSHNVRSILEEEALTMPAP